MEIKITTPLTETEIEKLHAGDAVLISGTIFTARDAAHLRMAQNGIPFDVEGEILYYMGPSPARPGKTIGSAGPTTSSRMDRFTPMLLEAGLKGMIGKGKRNREVLESIEKMKAVYFAAVGGAGALLSKCIKSAEVVAYPDLGTEAIYRLEVEDFPVIVAADCYGGCVYDD